MYIEHPRRFDIDGYGNYYRWVDQALFGLPSVSAERNGSWTIFIATLDSNRAYKNPFIVSKIDLSSILAVHDYYTGIFSDGTSAANVIIQSFKKPFRS